MKIGCTVSPKDYEKIAICKRAGFDYVEVSLNGLALSEAEVIDAFKASLCENKIQCTHANCLFPGSIKVCGSTFDESAVSDYLEKAFSVAEEIGIKIVVFGSGASRFIPEDFSREDATEQIKLVCIKYLDPIAAKHGVTVVIEPLNKKETNIFNSVSETFDFISSLGLKNVKCLADSYHMDVENEGYSIISKVGGELLHTHIANPNGRVIPLSADENDYKGFISALKGIGYCGGISVEAGTPEGYNLETALSQSAILLRELIK